MLPTQNAPIPGAASQPVLPDAVKQVIVHRMRRHDPPEWIAASIEDNFHIKVDRAQMLACWYERNPPPAQAVAAQTEPLAPEPTRTGPGQEKESPQIRTEPAQDIAAAPGQPRAESERAQVIRFATAPEMTAIQPERKEDKESVQFSADEAVAPLFTLMPCAETPDATPPEATPPDATPHATETAPATRTGPGQETESAEILDDVIVPDEVREHIIERMARRESPRMIAEAVQRKFGLLIDRDEIIVCWRNRDVVPTRTEPGRESESKPRLTDEMKEFIVKRHACYETPSRIAAALRLEFGIDIDRRRIFDYNPAGSRPPARRWIDLHAVTRANFLREVSEIGIAQKVVRLRTLERLADMAEESNRHNEAARYLAQAARECGGFYEKLPRS